MTMHCYVKKDISKTAKVVHSSECGTSLAKVSSYKINNCNETNSGACILERGKKAALEVDFKVEKVSYYSTL